MSAEGWHGEKVCTRMQVECDVIEYASWPRLRPCTYVRSLMSCEMMSGGAAPLSEGVGRLVAEHELLTAGVGSVSSLPVDDDAPRSRMAAPRSYS